MTTKQIFLHGKQIIWLGSLYAYLLTLHCSLTAWLLHIWIPKIKKNKRIKEQNDDNKYMEHTWNPRMPETFCVMLREQRITTFPEGITKGDSEEKKFNSFREPREIEWI